MKTPIKEYIDDLVYTDNDQDANTEESGGKDKREEKKDNLESYHSETDEREQISKIISYSKGNSKRRR